MPGKAKWKAGESRSDKSKLSEGRAQLVVDSIESDEGVDDSLELLHASDTGGAGVSYLVFGLPGTPTYQIWDLNHLPDHTAVAMRIYRSGRILSDTVFNSAGMQGAQPEAQSQSQEVPDWAFALAKTIAFGDSIDQTVAYPGSIRELLVNSPGWDENATSEGADAPSTDEGEANDTTEETGQKDQEAEPSSTGTRLQDEATDSESRQVEEPF